MTRAGQHTRQEAGRVPAEAPGKAGAGHDEQLEQVLRCASASGPRRPAAEELQIPREGKIRADRQKDSNEGTCSDPVFALPPFRPVCSLLHSLFVPFCCSPLIECSTIE